MKKRVALATQITIGIAVVLATILVVSGAAMDSLLRSRILSLIAGSCSNCQFTVQRVHVQWFPLVVNLQDLHLQSGDPRYTGVEADAEAMQIPIHNFSLAKKHFDLGKIAFQHLRVKITEGDLRRRPSRELAPESTPEWTFASDGVEVANAHFIYSHLYAPLAANLHILVSSASMGEFGTTPALLRRITHAQATALLETTGKIQLSVDALVHSPRLQVAVELQLLGLDLSEVSPFFERSGQIKMKGQLKLGKSKIQIQGSNLAGWTQVKYQNFKIDFSKNKTRSGFATFFMNWMSPLQMRSNDLSDVPENQYRVVKIAREADETPILFILRGMKTGALGVASNN